MEAHLGAAGVDSSAPRSSPNNSENGTGTPQATYSTKLSTEALMAHPLMMQMMNVLANANNVAYSTQSLHEQGGSPTMNTPESRDASLSCTSQEAVFSPQLAVEEVHAVRTSRELTFGSPHHAMSSPPSPVVQHSCRSASSSMSGDTVLLHAKGKSIAEVQNSIDQPRPRSAGQTTHAENAPSPLPTPACTSSTAVTVSTTSTPPVLFSSAGGLITANDKRNFMRRQRTEYLTN